MRVSSDPRLIVHKTEASFLLCFVDHHDKAYDWAERRKLETHPKTGAAQLVEIRETVKEVVVPLYVQTEMTMAPKVVAEAPPVLAHVPDDDLLAYGGTVPAEWMQRCLRKRVGNGRWTLWALTRSPSGRQKPPKQCWSWQSAVGKPRLVSPTVDATINLCSTIIWMRSAASA